MRLTMRFIFHHLLIFVAAAIAAESASADQPGLEDTPTQATVTSPGAPVRSGPGESFYLTDSLPEDTVVEIYRRRPDGWCAIRPPAESFSWVFAQNVRLIDDGIGEISKDSVASRVGSRLSAQRDVVQVRLHEGEQVAILGREERDARGQHKKPRDGGLWYKIAPPAGEFRWIRARDVGLADPQPEVVSADDLEALEDRYGLDRAVKTAALEETVDGTSNGITAPPLASGERSPATTPAASPSGAWAAAKSAPPQPEITPVGPSPPSTPHLAEHLSQLELQLSRMVAEPPATWNTAPLERSAEMLLSQADTVADREAIKTTLAKIDRFASIQRRYAGSLPAAASSATGVPTTSVTGTSPVATNNSPTSTSPYDAMGILRPVVSRRPGAPQFALVNPQGQVVAFVSPSPDVNLQPYVGQRIGVSGSRGYIPEFRRSHVTAGRVTPLNERMLR